VSSVIASHLVFADPKASSSDPDDADLVISRTAHLLHPTSHEALSDHVGDLRLSAPETISDLPIPPLPLLASGGVVPADAERIIDTATAAWSVILRTDEAAAVTAQYAARAAAALLAEDSAGVVVDLAIPRIWPRLTPDADPERTADWFVLERAAGEADQVSTMTRGLSRFGVPELRVDGVAAADVPAWDAVLTGLGHRLVTGGVTEVPVRVEVGLRDIAAGYAEPVDPDDPTLSRVTTVEIAYEDEVGTLTGTPVADLFTG
jgi:hypothetical protein